MGQILDKVVTLSDGNIETFSLIWLDTSVNKTDENLRAQVELQTTVSQLKTFEDLNECIKHIHSLRKEDRIVLIVSGSLGRHIIPRIHQLDQVLSTYIYCQDQNANEQWSSQYLKVKAVVTDLTELIFRIQIDHEKRPKNRLHETLPISIFDPKIIHEKLTVDLQGNLIHTQLLINCLLQMKVNIGDKNELISIGKQIYRKNRSELSTINEFEQKYTSNSAIWWYSIDSFIFRLFNKALRIQNLDILFYFQFFIIDIRRQLEKLRSTTPIKVYRSQLMAHDEFKRLKSSLGQFITINGFFSTTLDSNLALLYFDNNTDDSERILFEIDADPRLNSDKPFANIKSYGSNKEDEILFMIGSIFQIIEINRQDRNMWIIKLKFCSDNSEQLMSIDDDSKLLSFGHVLTTIGKIDEAETYYQRLLEDFEFIKHVDLARCYEALGDVANEKGDYDTSLELYHKSLKINLATSNKQSIDIASNYNHLGEIYRKKGNFKKAFSYYEKALTTLEDSSSGKSLSKQAICYNNIGIVYQDQQNYNEALEYYMKAYNIRKKYFPYDEISLGMSNNNVGNAYYFLKLYDEALYYYQEALKIYKKCLPPQHPKFASTYNNIGAIYDDQSKFNDALMYYTDAARIYQNMYPPTHPNIMKIDENIQRILSKVKN
ncbi:unnamed protein product [Adineta steineri]|uniref:Uncharacterized protein n=1 Tax=Adineta steineri TaxID=433720 RepID=A0A819N453_9BILA|nr:unnamed protein product [Adineta steineri]CAF3989176.1 unnamed protein product [Adineta steineri]